MGWFRRKGEWHEHEKTNDMTNVGCCLLEALSLISCFSTAVIAVLLVSAAVGLIASLAP